MASNEARVLHKRSVQGNASAGKDYIHLLWPNQLKQQLRRQHNSSDPALLKKQSVRRLAESSRASPAVRLPPNPLQQYVTHSTHYYSQKKSSEEYHSDHLEATFEGFRAMARFKAIPTPTLEAKAVVLPPTTASKTLVLDLDETLVHCCEGSEAADYFIPVTLPKGGRVLAGLRLRPYLIECLTAAKKWFEVVVFTASHQCYADAVLNFIDPEGCLVDFRLYRDSCIPVSGANIKDLRILGRNLKDVVIVDNLVQSFANQLDNGVPIISWYDDREDKELFKLIKYLNLLAHVEDVREVNCRMFKLERFYDDYLRSARALKSPVLSPSAFR